METSIAGLDVFVLPLWQRHKRFSLPHGTHAIGTPTVLPHSYRQAECRLKSLPALPKASHCE